MDSSIRARSLEQGGLALLLIALTCARSVQLSLKMVTMISTIFSQFEHKMHTIY